MLRGFTTTLAIVTALMMGAWAYSEQSRVASAGNPSIDIAGMAAPKGDRLQVGHSTADALDGYGIQSEARIIQAHMKAEEASARYLTVAQPGGPNETILTRVPVRD
jgi:hypothetical protein